MKVEETFKIKAPFFAYANIEEWEQIQLPDSISNIIQLENYLNATSVNRKEPYLFKLSCKIEAATVHIVNLPEGSVVHSPEEAHQGLTHYNLKNENVDLVGFYSTEHKRVFTHHDTNLHIHLITSDKSQMGHLEEINFISKNVILYFQKR